MSIFEKKFDALVQEWYNYIAIHLNTYKDILFLTDERMKKLLFCKIEVIPIVNAFEYSQKMFRISFWTLWKVLVFCLENGLKMWIKKIFPYFANET